MSSSENIMANDYFEHLEVFRGILIEECIISWFKMSRKFLNYLRFVLSSMSRTWTHDEGGGEVPVRKT